MRTIYNIEDKGLLKTGFELRMLVVIGTGCINLFGVPMSYQLKIRELGLSSD
jgi:hypothetical protein